MYRELKGFPFIKSATIFAYKMFSCALLVGELIILINGYINWRRKGINLKVPLPCKSKSPGHMLDLTVLMGYTWWRSCNLWESGNPTDTHSHLVHNPLDHVGNVHNFLPRLRHMKCRCSILHCRHFNPELVYGKSCAVDFTLKSG